LAASLFRVVVDTNVLLAGLASESSASQKIIDALTERKAVPLLSPQVLGEYRAVLLYPDVYTPHVKFHFPRDPRDAKLIELAIAGRATHIVTMDEDIHSLVTARTDAARRFRQRLPGTQVVRPAN